VKALDDFLSYPGSHPGVAYLRKDHIARFALEASDVPSA
jgi:hypothetical protein